MVVSEKSDAEGQFTGTYHTIVGEAATMLPATRHTGTMGFTVQWHNAFLNSKSVTTWSGQRQTDAQGGESIITTWLLTEETESPDAWSSTIVGTNVFTRKEVKAPAVPLHVHCCHPRDAHK